MGLRGKASMKIGIKELPEILNEKIKNPDITLEELRNKYGNLWVLNKPHILNICIYRNTNPCASLQNIGNNFELSRERIRQILKRANLQTKALRLTKNKFYCLNCGNPSIYKFCNKRCRYEYTNPIIECSCCHTQFRRRQVDLLRQNVKHSHYFCSKKCQGKWLADNYGFNIYPEHMKHMKKYDHNLIAILYSRGLQYREIMKIANISKYESVAVIIHKLIKSGRIKRRINFKNKFIEKLLLEKKSYKEISQSTNTSLSAVYQIKYKLQKRNA